MKISKSPEPLRLKNKNTQVVRKPRYTETRTKDIPAMPRIRKPNNNYLSINVNPNDDEDVNELIRTIEDLQAIINEEKKEKKEKKEIPKKEEKTEKNDKKKENKKKNESKSKSKNSIGADSVKRKNNNNIENSLHVNFDKQKDNKVKIEKYFERIFN